MTKVRRAEEVELDARRGVSGARRTRILAKTDGLCARTGCEARAVEIDHIVPLALGGRDEDWNLEGLCGPHHAQKTKADVKAIAKAKRAEKKHLGEDRPSKRPIKSRGFQRDFTKGFDGKIKPRKHHRERIAHDEQHDDDGAE